MSTDYKFQGWLGHDAEAANGNMTWESYEPKKWTEDDVDIKISHCGICGSDLHTLSSGWGATKYREFPQVDKGSRILTPFFFTSNQHPSANTP